MALDVPPLGPSALRCCLPPPLILSFDNLDVIRDVNQVCPGVLQGHAEAVQLTPMDTLGLLGAQGRGDALVQVQVSLARR